MLSPLDLYDVRFWLFTALGVIILNPLVSAPARRWSFALLNLLFLSAYLGKKMVLVLAAIGSLHLLIRLLRVERVGTAVAGLCGIGTLTLFIFHKIPDLFVTRDPRLHHLEFTLVIVGFSYVALRLYELGRAMFERRHPAPDLASIVNYLLPFHMLAAGPIQAYDDFVAQPSVPAPLGPVQTLSGFERIATGLFKKYVLAKALQDLFLTDYRSTGWYPIIEAQLTFIWLYLDFSAYSDVAVGVGRLMGIATPENFNRPYLARNIIEFWERWHISLSMFIRRNVFVPTQLHLMRLTEGTWPLLIASLAFTFSFLLCGLWHQISLRWFAWGAFHAAGLIACNMYKHRLLKKLGRKGVNHYLANRSIHVLSTILTFEFNVLAVVIVTYPFEVPTWIPGRNY